MRVTVVGAGYVGLASALAFAADGHDVVCVERNPMRLAQLRRGEDPLDEPSVASLLKSTTARFVAADTEIDRAEIVVVAVGTPMRRDGHADLAQLAGVVGADADAVLRSMSFDPRIGSGHLRPGLGWGGSCFPKDTRALAALAAGEGYDFIILKAAIEQNSRQLARFARIIERETPEDGTVGLLGLAFKAGTADTRESPAIALARRLARRGR